LSISRRLPQGISDEDEKAAVAELSEALDDLPADASEPDMEEARDQIVEDYQREYKEKSRRAEKKAAQARNKANLVQYGLTRIPLYAERLLRQFDYESGETAWDIDRRVRTEVQKTLEEELSGGESEQEVARIATSPTGLKPSRGGEEQHVALALVIAFFVIMRLELDERFPQRTFSEQDQMR
jgi:hypothetical protein